MSAERIVHPDPESLATGIADRLGRLVTATQSEGREPHVVLTGGTIAIAAYERLRADAADWSRVHWWWGDERFVPAGHADRNDQQARDAFLDRLAVPADHVHAMPAHGCSESMAEAADGYAATLPANPFDLVLLGMGPDGHVASLFPGFAQLTEMDRRCVEVFGSPKPPSERITLTFPALNHAAEVWFLVSGESKAEALTKAFGDGPVFETPARGVRGLQQTLWLLDEGAASGS
ncbi:MAG: 6-phosphogluconolactonase [Aeromicrobium sp.]|uniref:6-phosphogluconolactonase n=1 Tax=Aeromicrobium sp. TaxID=1871063 RepID=UPI003C3F2588